jgi:hypothetical protein
MTESTTLFNTAPKDYLSVYENYPRIVSLLEFGKKDVARAAHVPLTSVRYDNKMPRELVERLREWGVLLNIVAQYFQGDTTRTVLWFLTPNPLLGNIKPRDMIRFGRYQKLLNFIWNALNENEPQGSA